MPAPKNPAHRTLPKWERDLHSARMKAMWTDNREKGMAAVRAAAASRKANYILKPERREKFRAAHKALREAGVYAAASAKHKPPHPSHSRIKWDTDMDRMVLEAAEARAKGLKSLPWHTLADKIGVSFATLLDRRVALGLPIKYKGKRKANVGREQEAVGEILHPNGD